MQINSWLTLSVVSMVLLTTSLSGYCQDSPSTPYPPKEIIAENISFDVKSGEVKYSLSEPALVRIRIGKKYGGPLLRVLVDWEERAAGEHVEKWDGKDKTGRVSYPDRTDLMLVISCLPADPLERKNYRETVRGLKKAPKFSITFPSARERNADGVPVIDGRAPVRVQIHEEDQKWLADTKYELALYIDNSFLMEDEEGVNPYTYHLNTIGLNDGLHSITVNLIGFDGDAGTESVLVYVRNKKKP